MSTDNKKRFRFLLRKMYPNGRAFRILMGTDSERYHNVTAEVLGEAQDMATGLIDHIIPDNSNFDAADATAWERRLGIITNTAIPLADRITAIIQKWNYPGDNKYRQHRAFIEAQLRLAGYDVRVYENRFAEGGGYVTKTPSEVLGIAIGNAVLDEVELDEVELDQRWSDAGITLCVQYLEEEKDEDFAIGDSYHATFFVAGETIDSFASVAVERKLQFRQLILQLKKVEMVGILFVNYV